MSARILSYCVSIHIPELLFIILHTLQTHALKHREAFAVHTPLLDCDTAGYSESQRRKWEVGVQGGERRGGGEAKSGSEAVGGEERRRDDEMVRRRGRRESEKERKGKWDV